MKENRGITMVTLVITIVVLLIIAGISIGTGNKVIKSSELENVKTNMLLIKVKGKEYVENANFKLGTKIGEVSEEEKATRIGNAKNELKGEDITDDISLYEDIIVKEESEYIFYYKLSNESLTDIGLTNVKSDEENGWYIIRYDIENVEVEVYNTKGFETEEGTYYSLNEIENLNI